MSPTAYILPLIFTVSLMCHPLHAFSSLSFTIILGSRYWYPILQMRKLKLRKVKPFVLVAQCWGTCGFEPTPDREACAGGGRSSVQPLGPVIWELPALVVIAWVAPSTCLASLSTGLPGEGRNWGAGVAPASQGGHFKPLAF